MTSGSRGSRWRGYHAISRQDVAPCSRIAGVGGHGGSHEAKLDLTGKPDGIRESVREFFATQGGEWEVRVQLCVDLDAMPIEDASAKWPEDKSPYITVARITVGPQDT